jgi:hypothetical protein
VIEAKFRRNRKRVSSVPSLCCRQEHLLFHPDVPEESDSKVIVRCLLDVMWGSNGGLKELL